MNVAEVTPAMAQPGAPPSSEATAPGFATALADALSNSPAPTPAPQPVSPPTGGPLRLKIDDLGSANASGAPGGALTATGPATEARGLVEEPAPVLSGAAESTPIPATPQGHTPQAEPQSGMLPAAIAAGADTQRPTGRSPARTRDPSARKAPDPAGADATPPTGAPSSGASQQMTTVPMQPVAATIFPIAGSGSFEQPASATAPKGRLDAAVAATPAIAGDAPNPVNTAPDIGTQPTGLTGAMMSGGATHAAAAATGNTRPRIQVAAEPLVSARHGAIGTALGVEIAHRIGESGDALTVRLHPQELGRIDIAISFDESGKLRATMRAESSVVIDLLRRDSADLGRALDQAGVRADAQSFSFESQSGNDRSGRGHSQQAPARPMQGQPADAPSQIPYRPIRTSGRLDLFA